MPLTPAEQRELEMLERELERRRAREAQEAERDKPIPQDDGFSVTRLLGGVAQDTYNGLLDTVNWFGEKRDDAFGAISGGYLDPRTYRTKEENEASKDYFRMEVVGESTNTAESITRSIGGFLVPYMGAAKLMKVGQATTLGGRLAGELAAVTAVNMTVMDAQENNLANTLRDSFGLESDVLDAIATEEDDDLMVGRLKAAVSNLPLEIAGTALIEGGIHGFKALRSMRAANAEQRGLIEATQNSLKINAFKPKPKPADPKAPKKKADASVGTEADEAFKLEAVDVLKGIAGDADAPVIKVEPKEVTTFDDVINFVKEVVDEVPPGQERYLQDLADRLMKEPHQAISELGIDPLKLNLDDVDSAESIMAIRDGLSDMIEHVARRTGESKKAGGKVISWVQTKQEAAREIALSARTFGSSWRAVKRTIRSTQTLRADMMASRMLVGANAQRLVGSVDPALKEVEAGVPHGPAWTNTIKRLEEQALLDGALTGAKSEVARTLNILKSSTEALDPDRIVDDAAEAAEDAFSKKYEELFKDLATDAGRIRLLNQIKQNGGDLETLTKVVKQRRLGRLRRVDSWLTEAKANLFSYGTAGFNVASATFMQTFDAFTHLLSGAGLKVAGKLTRNEAMLQGAAIQLNKGYASFDAPVMAFGDAVRGMFKMIGSEWLDEVAVTLDTVGLEKWAKSAAIKSADLGSNVKRGWLKKDMRNGTKAIYISPEVLRAQDQKIAELAGKFPIGTFGQMALEWTMRGATRAGALGVNLAGSATRANLSLFISGPDTFAGTISAQIGKNVKAVELATEEAIEAGLTGKAFAGYVKGRSKDLSDLVGDGTSAQAFSDAQRDMMERAGNKYAARNNFADDLESTSLKLAASTFENAPIAGTMTMPFPRTPLKVMETTLIDYTPLGVLKGRVKDAFINGDVATRGEIATRYMLATTVLAAAWQMAESGMIVGQDGGWQNTARRNRASYTIKIGDDYHDISRIDPIGTVLGIVADAHYALTADLDTLDPRAEQEGLATKVPELLMEAAFWPLMQNVFNKAMLETLDSVMGVSQADTPESMGQAFERFFTSSATRFVPGSGVQRQIDKWDDGTFRAARGFADGWLKASVGADKLPPRLDTLFGRPVQMPLGERLIGWKGGPGLADKTNQELARLAFDLRPPPKTMDGVKLTQVQYNRYLELRGHEVRLGGKTLEERIAGLIENPRWDDIPDPRKIEMIKDTISPYSSAAKRSLMREDDDFNYRRAAVENRERFIRQGRSIEEADKETRRFAEELGLQVEY